MNILTTKDSLCPLHDEALKEKDQENLPWEDFLQNHCPCDCVAFRKVCARGWDEE